MFESITINRRDESNEKERRNRKEFARLSRYAFLAGSLMFSGEAKAWINFENDVGVDENKIENILEETGLPSRKELKDVRVVIPKVSQERKYIVHIPQQHTSYGLVEETDEDREETAHIQESIYRTIQIISKHYPYVTYHSEGMLQGDNGDRWEVQKRALQQVTKKTISAIDSAGPRNPVNVKAVFDDVSNSLKGQEEFSRSMMHKVAFEIQNTLEKKNVDASRYDQKYLNLRNPLGKITEYYYGGDQKAYYRGFVQTVKGCEDEGTIREIAEKYKSGVSVDASLDERREQFVVKSAITSMDSSPEPVSFVTYGGWHDFKNNIEAFNTENNRDVGYMVFVPK